MNHPSPQNIAPILKKVVVLHKSIGFTAVNLLFSLLQIIGGFTVLLLSRYSVESGSLKMIIYIFSILNILLVFIYISRFLYFYFGILPPPILISNKLVLYELSFKALKMMFISAVSPFILYEQVLVSESKSLFFGFIFMISFDIVTSSCAIFGYTAYFIFAILLMRTLEADSLHLTQENISNYESCAICLDDYSVGQNLLSLACKHSFHESCINRWLDINKSCPACKKELWLDIIIYQNNKIKL